MLVHKGGQINNVQLITGVRIAEMSQLQNCSVMCTKNGSYCENEKKREQVRGEGGGGQGGCERMDVKFFCCFFLGGWGGVSGGGGKVGGQGGCERRSEAFVKIQKKKYFFFFFGGGGGSGGIRLGRSGWM